jgi:hypothetical protein
MRLRSVGSVVVSLVVVLTFVSTAIAQETTTGSITGRVLDPQGLPTPGVTVTVTSSQGSKSAVTDTDGVFYVPFLTPGTYSVRAELQGFKAVEQANVDVQLGRRTEMNLKLEAGGITETVTVTSAATVVDTSSTTAGAVISDDLLQRVPVGRRLTDALYLAPGVSSGGEVGRANPSIAGGSGLENQYIVDGVNITNSGYGAIGSYSIVFGSLGNGVTFDFVKEIQVKTGGYEAEYGSATGGVVNVLTKSGTNEISGSAFTYFRPDSLEGDYTNLDLENGTQIAAQRTATRVNDVGFEAGGPIVQNKAFWFAALNPQWEREKFTALPIFPLFSLGEVDRDRRTITYSAKGTWQLMTNHRIDASFFGDPAKGDDGPQRTAAFRREDTAGFSAIEYGGHNQTVKYDGIMGPNWLIEASYARAQNRIEEIPSTDEWAVSDRTVVPNIARGGVGFFEQNDGTNQQFAVKSTHIYGAHQIRAGLSFDLIDYLQGSDRTGPTYTTSGGVVTATGAEIRILSAPEIPQGRIYRVTRANFQAFRETEQQYFNFFIQDTYRLRNLTLRPGLRYEQQKLVGNAADFKWSGNWAPRIGATYDFTGSGRSKVYANWGRFFARVPNDLAARALSADAGVTRDDFFDPGLTQPVPAGTSAAGTTTHYLTAGLSAAEFDPESKSTYLDEFLIGFEYELLPRLNIGVRYTHRNFGRVLEDVGLAPMISYFLPQFESQLGSVEYFITNPTEETPIQLPPPGVSGISFEKAIHDYDSVEFTADKRFGSGWGVQASYRWSRLWGNFEGFFRNDNGQSDPAITSLFDFPTNDPSYVSLGRAEGFRGDIRFLGDAGAGPLPNDRTHQAKVYGNYLFDMGLNVGLGLFLSSGSPLTALAANPAYDSPGEIPETPRGDGFDTVDGFKTRTPVESSFDFHADYGVRFGNQRLTFLADVFNLFDQQTVISYDNYTESSFHAANPDFGRPWRYQTPRQIRFGLRFEF